MERKISSDWWRTPNSENNTIMRLFPVRLIWKCGKERQISILFKINTALQFYEGEVQKSCSWWDYEHMSRFLRLQLNYSHTAPSFGLIHRSIILTELKNHLEAPQERRGLSPFNFNHRLLSQRSMGETFEVLFFWDCSGRELTTEHLSR